MVQIVANFQPFTMSQQILVYEGNNIIDSLSVDSDDVINVIKGLKNKYSADEINLVGNTDYLSKFQKDLSTDFDMTKIKIIQRGI